MNRYVAFQQELNQLTQKWPQPGTGKQPGPSAQSLSDVDLYRDTYTDDTLQADRLGLTDISDKERSDTPAVSQSLWAYAHTGPAPTTTQMSDDGFRFIADREAFVDHVYTDATGNPTIGFGHLILPGEDFRGRTLTIDQATELMRTEVAQKEAVLNAAVRVSLTAPQFDAIISLMFNIGTGAFGTSTLLRRLNEGNYEAAADQFLRWNKGKVGGKLVVIRGLTLRRQAERKIFRGEGYPAIGHAEARGLTRLPVATAHSYGGYGTSYSDVEEGEVMRYTEAQSEWEGGAFSQTVQDLATAIRQLITANPQAFSFMHDESDQLAQVASGGRITSARGTTTDVSPDPVILTTLHNIMQASLSSTVRPAFTLMSLVRPPKKDKPSRHTDGRAIDIARINGVTINDANSQAVLDAVILAINNLAAGHCRLGFPRARASAQDQSLFIGLEWNEISPHRGNLDNPSTTAGLTREQVLARRRASLERMDQRAAQLNPRPGANSWRYQILAVDNEPARQALTTAMNAAERRGVIIDAIFADGVDHLHIST